MAFLCKPRGVVLTVMERRRKILKSRKFVRHKKKNWGKHCDVTEIDEWFEERRKQQASGYVSGNERQ